VRGELFRLLSHDILSSDIPLSGSPILDHESIGLHYYDPQKLSFEKTDYNPPHMDAGTLTILVRYPGDHDGLEVTDLDSTDKRGSEGVGQEASFLPVPAALDEVVVFAGTRMQRLFGRSKVRACVHRVCGPSQADKPPRLSLGIFCAVPAV
jgi:isopenicillin N synthase-like dioxygenase